MFRQLICKMTDPIRRFRLVNTNVLPFCYELALGQQRNFSVTLEATDQSNEKSQNIEENPYFAKYADKIKKAQKTTNPATEDLESAKQETVPIVNKDNVPKESVVTEPQIKGNDLSMFLYLILMVIFFTENKPEIDSGKEMKKSKRYSLDDIVKLDLMQDKTAEEISQIWNEYHSKKDGIYATIPADVYNTLFKNSVTYPSFILPLPRNQDQTSGGYEFFLLQFQEHCVYFTSLAAYHLHKEIAPVCLTLYHYPELLQSKGLVLMNSEYDSNILNILECQCLANQLQHYYTTKEAAQILSLHLFNKEPKSFDHMRLVRHLEDGILSSGLGAVNLNKQD